MRVWDKFLTERDKAHLARYPQIPRFGFGEKPALLMIDHYKAGLGEEPLPLLESMEKYPLSMGLEAWEAVAHTKELLDVCRELKVPVIYTTMLAYPNSPWEWYTAMRVRPESPTRDGATLVNPSGEESVWDIVPQLAPVPEDVVIRKLGASAFFGTPLNAVLHRFGIDTLLVTGNSTSGCIRATVVDAACECYRTIVVEECVYDRTEAAHALNLFDIEQKYGDVLALSEVVGWLRANVAHSVSA
jgi:nicotinamidase-related amidase